MDKWRKEHDDAKEARLEYGITDGPVYMDETKSNTMLVHLDVEQLEKAFGWFKDERFKLGVERAGKVEREIWIANEKG